MKTTPALLLLALPITTGLVAETNRNAPAAPVSATAKVTAGTILAAQIREIADTKELNPASKRRQIATAVRLAVTTALTNVKDPQQAFQILLELSTEAARTLPEFSNLIADAVAGASLKLPVLAGRADLIAKIRDAVDATVAQADGTESEAAGAETPKSQEKAKSSAPEFGAPDTAIIVSPSS